MYICIFMAKFLPSRNFFQQHFGNNIPHLQLLFHFTIQPVSSSCRTLIEKAPTKQKINSSSFWGTRHSFHKLAFVIQDLLEEGGKLDVWPGSTKLVGTAFEKGRDCPEFSGVNQKFGKHLLVLPVATVHFSLETLQEFILPVLHLTTFSQSMAI